MKITNAAIGETPAALGLRGHLVYLTDEFGNIGMGECSPLPNYSPDDIAGAPWILNDVAARIGQMDDDLESIAARLDVFSPALGPASRFAFETALLNLLSMRKNKPISHLLGGGENARVPVNGVVGASGNVDAWNEEAAAILERAIRVIKVKLGRSEADFDREHAALRDLRKKIPRDVELRLDANGCFGERAHERLAALADVQPSYVEEPTHGEALLTLGRCDVPWAADESLLHDALVDGFLESSACAVVILKPALLGGLFRTRKIALRAIGKKIGVVITHLFDGNVAHAASCELALSLDAPLACGLDAHEGLVSPSPYLKIPGFVSAP